MWNRKKTRKPLKRIESLISAGTVVYGNIAFVGGLRIDGSVKGNVIATDGEPAMLVIGQNARIEGDVRVSHVVVNGTIHGQVTVEDHIELQPKARVIGDVSYGTLEMHLGAVVQGRLHPAEPAASSVVEFRRAIADEPATKPAHGSSATR